MKKVTLLLVSIGMTMMMVAFSLVSRSQVDDELIEQKYSQIASKKLSIQFEFEGVIIDEEMIEYGTNITVNVSKGQMIGQKIKLVLHDGNYCEECENYHNEGFKGDFAIGEEENIGRKVKGMYKEGKCFVEDYETGDTSEETCYRPIQLNYN